ncbi:MAG: transposase [Sulfobacillus sp.]
MCFTDFKTFNQDGTYNQHNTVVYRKKNSKREIKPEPKPKYPCSMRVFGILTSAGALPLVEVDQNLNARDAQLLLQDALPKIVALLGSEYVLEMDHDPVFTAQSTQEWLEDNAAGFFTPEQTPVRSPDYWPIENVWGEMSGMVHDAHAKNKEQLRAAVHAAWRACTTAEKLQHYYEGMARRMRRIVEARGKMTKY